MLKDRYVLAQYRNELELVCAPFTRAQFKLGARFDREHGSAKFKTRKWTIVKVFVTDEHDTLAALVELMGFAKTKTLFRTGGL